MDIYFNDEQHDRLVTQIKQRLAHGQTREEILDDLKDSVTPDDLFFAYQAALILHNDEVEFGEGYVYGNGRRHDES